MEQMQTAIQVNHLMKKYKGFTLEVENLHIPKGFSTALIGENGAGKTTLLNILAGIRLDYKGEITYFDQWSDKEREKTGNPVKISSSNLTRKNDMLPLIVLTAAYSFEEEYR